MSNHSDLYTVVKINVVNIKASSLHDKTERYYGKNEIQQHDKHVSYVYFLLRHVETRQRGEVANKTSLLKDLSGRKVKNQGGRRNG